MAKNDNKRVHGAEAAGAGELDGYEDGPVLGKCPSCGCELRIGYAIDPETNMRGRVLLHAIPFCAYFGKTSAEEIAKALS